MNSICKCGKEHKSSINEVIIKSGAIKEIPELIGKYGSVRPFILADENTYKAAGEAVCCILESKNINFSKYIFNKPNVAPDENSVGSVCMHYDNDCDMIIAVGSGVINDIGKIISRQAKNPYIIVATAPSVDGYSSKTSSVEIDGFKVSVNSKCPDVIIGDIDILKNAPIRMIQSGLGDMLAKYISICEWRIGNIILNEYYCEYVAQMVRDALKQCVDNAEGILKRDEKAVKAVFEGLVVSGMAMEYAGISRPASGVEHYISHIWDMRGLAFGTKTDFHGIQCGIGTLVAAKIYEQVKKVKPDREKALKYAGNFDLTEWNSKLREFIGGGAETMIKNEEKDHKYSVPEHSLRLEKIINNWDKILEVIDEELIPSKEIEKILDSIGAPKFCNEIGIEKEILPMTFYATKDVRDKYILSRLCWDLGIIDDIKF